MDVHEDQVIRCGLQFLRMPVNGHQHLSAYMANVALITKAHQAPSTHKHTTPALYEAHTNWLSNNEPHHQPLSVRRISSSQECSSCLLTEAAPHCGRQAVRACNASQPFPTTLGRASGSTRCSTFSSTFWLTRLSSAIRMRGADDPAAAVCASAPQRQAYGVRVVEPNQVYKHMRASDK